MTQDEWIKIGITSGFCGIPACQTHDTVELTEEEQDLMEEGHDPCIVVVRIIEQA